MTSPLRGRIANLFPPGVAFSISDPRATLPQGPVEEQLLVAHANPSRRNEFFAGRTCARHALSELGVSAPFIGTAADRTPLWPSGIVGSITHCQGFCGAAVAQTSTVKTLGFDAEVKDGVLPNERSMICSEDEARHFASLRGSGIDWFTLAFSAKEAFYKSFYVATRTYLDFRDVIIHFDPSNASSGNFRICLLEQESAVAAIVRATNGRWLIADNFVFASAFTAPPGPS